MRSLLIIGTGGTIAGVAPEPTQTLGYRAGALPVARLVATVPGLADLAAVRTLEPFSIGSQHMTSGHWLILAGLLRDAVADATVDAIVITHGTDTMEETAFFLDLVLPRGKPVVLTGAMHPATAASADGPANLLGACRFALDAGGGGRGVLVAFSGCAFSAATVGKVHTLNLEAFAARDAAPVGRLVGESVHWNGPAELAASQELAGLRLPARLPPVALILQHVDCDESVVDWHVARGAAGIVIAGSGNGMLPDPMRAALARASRSGCSVVRATRVAGGPVVRNAEADPADSDDALGFIASGRVAPLKARVLLQCCLVAGFDAAAIQRQFLRFGQEPSEA